MNLREAAGMRKREPDLQVRWREQAGGTLRPLHDAQRIRREVLPESCILPFLVLLETIKIKVIQVYARKVINFNQRIRRALRAARVAKCMDEAARERGFARTKVAREVQHETAFCAAGE